jgi:macrolide transport system ATP-binding/permease protein
VLVISHDRYFLDNITNRIVELENGVCTEYLGNYTYYVEEKARRESNESREDEEELRYRERTNKRIARGR